ncbi:MAG TPA: glutamine--tRNA ligase, partial [Anaeromyxobacteraceae bacterium]|nr:glutamine--tRNA ligase [Anaeromyxobacteraceae bacterium]
DFLAALNPDSLVVAREARIEPALANASPGSLWQFLRQGWFFADPVDSRPGAPAWNRTIGLKDGWAARAAPRPEARRRKEAAPAAPPAARRTRTDARAELRASRPDLAERFRRYQAELGLGPGEADRLAGDPAVADYFDAAVAAHGQGRSVARWLLNELLGLARERPVGALPLPGAAFGRFVALVDAGRLAPAAAKTLLADLVRGGGDPEARMKALGLEKVEDRAAIEAAVGRVLAARKAEADRYRAGERKLLGVLLGAAMRETQGAADAAAVREVLERKLSAS